MEFLKLLPTVCHPEQIILKPGPTLYCNTCEKDVISNIYDYIKNQNYEDNFYSSALAQAYHAWTGDEQVPMNFPLVNLKGILDTTIKGQSLGRVYKSIRLLRALNAPFTTNPNVEHTLEMETFLNDFLKIISEHPNTESSSERTCLDAMIKAMHTILSSGDFVNPFDTYLEVLVPFVQQSEGKWKPYPHQDPYPNAAKELLFQLYRSAQIRAKFSKYVMPFDIIHVMVGCYACSCDMEVVANWTLDFMARICRGEFFWKNCENSPFVQAMQKLIHSEISYKKNTEYHKVCRAIIRGESVEHYSTFWVPFRNLQILLKEKYAVPNVTDKVLNVAFTQTFPAVLFSDFADQMGFAMGYNHLILTLNKKNGMLPKGTCKLSKQTHIIVQKFIQKIVQFEKIPLEWTLNTVKLFFASDPNFENELVEVVKLLLNDINNKE